MAASSIGAHPRPTVLLVGAASRDLDPADPRGWRLGGGVTYGAMALAGLGLPVRALIGVDAQAARATELGMLRRAGVEVRAVELDRGPVFELRSLPGDGRSLVAHQASDGLAVAALPADWAASDAVVLSPVAGELGDGWAEAFPPPALVALGWQGLLRVLRPGRPVEALPIRSRPLFARADLAIVSAEDAAAGGVPLERLLTRAGQRLIVSHGPRPAFHVARRQHGLRMRLLPVEPAAVVGDDTGAGDVLLAGWAAGVALLAQNGVEGEGRALALAFAMARARVQGATIDELASLREQLPGLLRPPAAGAHPG